MILGQPSALTDWCRAVVRELVHLSGAQVAEIEPADGVRILQGLLLAQAGTRTVAYVRRPDLLARRSIAGSKAPFLVLACSPIAAGIRLSATAPEIQALKQTMADIASLAAMADQPGALVIREADAKSDGVGTVAAMVRHLQLDIPNDAVSKVALAHRLIEGASAPRRETGLIETVLGGVDQLLADGKRRGISLPPAMFTDYRAGKPFQGPLDAAGDASRLISGPSVCLPAGEWRADCVYTFSPDMITGLILVDVASTRQEPYAIARTPFTITWGGEVRIQVAFRVFEPDEVIDIRLWTEQMFTSGKVDLIRVDVVPVSLQGT